jgi:hypothetical protein
MRVSHHKCRTAVLRLLIAVGFTVGSWQCFGKIALLLIWCGESPNTLFFVRVPAERCANMCYNTRLSASTRRSAIDACQTRMDTRLTALHVGASASRCQ